MKKYLRFDCGAALPRNREMTPECEKDLSGVCHIRKRDGAYRLIVFDTESPTESGRPALADGTTARCFAQCPANKTKAGRKVDRCFPSDDKLIGKQWRWVVTCHGKLTDERPTNYSKP